MISSNSNSELNNILTGKNQDDSQEIEHLITEEDQDNSQELDHLLTDQDGGQELGHLLTEDQDGSEEIERLMTREDQNGNISREQQASDNGGDCTIKRKRSIKLLLIRIPWFITGSVILVIALVLSQYHIDLPYQPVEECDDVLNDTNVTVMYNDTLSYQNSIAMLRNQ